MKVLWLCNIMLPRIAKQLSLEVSNKEGWLTGLSDRILMEQEDNQIELGVAFPVSKEQNQLAGMAGEVSFYGFYEDVTHPEVYKKSLESRMKQIIDRFQPDIIHIFGTEYTHTLAMVRAFGKPDKTLIGIQGLCSVYATHFMANLPFFIQNRFLLRDFLKQDNIKQQQKQCAIRGIYEVEALRNVNHITGRTDWDKAISSQVHQAATYHFMNETLRDCFYGPQWSLDTCTRHHIFVSQGNYPIKGLHYMIEALVLLKREYPDVKVFVAGDVITKYETLRDKIKISSYGKYILDLINKNDLKNNICFVGKLDARQMCEAYLDAHVFVSPSVIENSPNSIGEAMILGVPTVSSYVGGVASMLTHEQEGFLYQADAPYMLAAYVSMIFREDTLANQLSNQGRKKALQTHNPDENYKRLMEIYQQL